MFHSTDPLTGETWRFDTITYPLNGETSIFRGRIYQVPDDGGDSWRWYWDGDLFVAVYDDDRYVSPTRDGNPDDTARVEDCMTQCARYGQDTDAALTRLARRLTGQWDARFITVNIDRGVSLYVLSWDGDPSGEWAREIEAVYNGDVWRIETEEWEPALGENGKWQPADDVCTEFYGEDQARAGFEAEFPLTEFPADLFVTADN